MYRALLALLLAPVLTNPAFAQGWPTRPIQTVVPLTAGSAVDVVTRAVMEQVSAQIGQPVVIENRSGGGNTIAMAAVARAEPDGYTLLANSATHSLVPVTFASLPFDTFRDLTPIVPFGNTPLVMVVSPAKGYKNVRDFVAAAKDKKGGTTYSSAGVGNSTHFAMEAFRLAAGFEAVHVPFRGAPEAMTEVLAERADFYFSPLPAALPLLRDGKLAALAVSGSQRASALPDVPTLAETGFPEATYNFWIGLFAPSKVPEAIIERLYRDTAKVLQQPALKERLARMALDPLPLDRAGFAKMIQDEYALNAKVAKAAGIKPN